MKNKKTTLILIAVSVLVALVSLWGPEFLADYRDEKSLNQVRQMEAAGGGEGYRYTMSSDEKLFVLAKCLNSQSQPESERNAAIYQNNLNYEELAGTYAFVVNKQGPSEQEITETDIAVNLRLLQGISSNLNYNYIMGMNCTQINIKKKGNNC